MPGAYQEIRIKVTGEEQRYLLVAKLEDIGYESFVEEDQALIAYVPAGEYHPGQLAEIIRSVDPGLQYTDRIQQDRNWNATWEKNYPPVLIADRCYIRAPFHPEREGIPYEILIEPRMAFGTAHHETTAMMIEWLLESDLQGKQVLDMGCGTGVLAILANKLGASDVMAVDNDDWAYQNSLDNVALNHASHCSVVRGDAKAISGKQFDVILANINRNILTNDIPAYSQTLKTGGTMCLSGFYEKDIPVLDKLAEQHGLVQQGVKQQSAWTAVCYRKR